KALIQPMAASHGILIVDEVGSDVELWVEADRQRLRQILVNLLSNAVKYNRPRGSMWIAARSVEGTVEIDCLDSGPGIRPEKVDRLFSPFDRLDAETGSIEGTGLGLALSKRLAVSMGGDIAYLSDPSRPGSLFRVTLKATNPIQRETGHAVGVPELSPLAKLFAGKKILYIEDNLSNIRLMEGIMAEWPDAQLLVAQQGRMGVDLALEHHPDVILLDLHLPDMPGDQVLSAIHAHSLLSRIPVIVLSADATARQMTALRQAGAFDYVTKPFQLRELIETITSALKV
ncbi:MAG TPA: ATP-binding protein, partial [Fimbriimonadaceae bacterium]|nr:ATP-binding protein [Fimbriimonadaceae bacterium]